MNKPLAKALSTNALKVLGIALAAFAIVFGSAESAHAKGARAATKESVAASPKKKMVVDRSGMPETENRKALRLRKEAKAAAKRNREAMKAAFLATHAGAKQGRSPGSARRLQDKR